MWGGGGAQCRAYSGSDCNRAAESCESVRVGGGVDGAAAGVKRHFEHPAKKPLALRVRAKCRRSESFVPACTLVNAALRGLWKREESAAKGKRGDVGFQQPSGELRVRISRDVR